MTAEEKKALGRRLKRAAKAAGLTSAQIGERLCCSDGAVRGWWRGRSSPDPGLLRRYAEAVEADAAALLEERSSLDAEGERLARLYLRAIDAAMRGLPPSAAYAEAVPESQPLSARERRFFDLHAAELRAFIEARAGRSWATLPARERLDLVRQLLLQWLPATDE